MSPSETKWAQVGNPVKANEFNWNQIIQARPSGPKWIQVKPCGTKWIQVKLCETKWVQVELSETKWLQVKTIKNQVNPNEAKWVQAALSETEQVQVKPNQTKWNQMGLRELHCTLPPSLPISLQAGLIGKVLDTFKMSSYLVKPWHFLPSRHLRTSTIFFHELEWPNIQTGISVSCLSTLVGCYMWLIWRKESWLQSQPCSRQRWYLV